MCPAVGQGALAIETRDDGGPAWEIVKKLDHADSRKAVEAERALLAVLGGGCQVPIGAHARIASRIHPPASHSSVARRSRVISGELEGTDPQIVGAELGRRLLEAGAREILGAVYAA